MKNLESKKKHIINWEMNSYESLIYVIVVKTET